MSSGFPYFLQFKSEFGSQMSAVLLDRGVWEQGCKRKLHEASCSSSLMLGLAYYVKVRAKKHGYFSFCLRFVSHSRPLAELTVLGKIRR